MQAAKKKILFLSHEASLSGAPLVLLEFMRWLKLNKQTEMALLLKDGGAVKEQFAEVCEVYLYQTQPKQFSSGILSAIDNRLIRPRQEASYRDNLLKTLKKKKFDLIYANTAGLGSLLEFLKPLGVKVISHIHELQYVLQCSGAENIRQTVANSSAYIAVSNEVKDNLINTLGIDKTKIKVFPPFIDFEKIDGSKDETDTAGIRRQLQIPANSFIVGGAGSIEWRKGADIFTEVAKQVLDAGQDVYFIWLGGERERNTLEKLNYDIEKAGMQKRVQFLGPRSNPYPYYQAFDLLLLSSREDPYPLVCIENLYLKKPVVCFENAGGAGSMVRTYQNGKCLPYLNVNLMAEAVMDYASGKLKPNALVDTQLLRDEHSVNTISPKIFDAINER